MDELERALASILAVGGSMLVGPLVAVAALLWRRRQNRLRRRSPITLQMLRPPGHSLREQLDDASNDIGGYLLGLAMWPPMLLSAHLLLQRGGSAVPSTATQLIYWSGLLIGVAVMAYLMLKTQRRMDDLRAGYDAELAVGQELDQLMRQGAAVFHDFPAEGFNIDHVVISRRGVFAVETKGYSKPGDLRGKAGATVVFDGQCLAFPRYSTREPLEQAERQAQWLGKWLCSAAGEAVVVLPVLALPGWFVERRGRGAVRVYAGPELARLLDAKGGSALSAEAMQRVVHQVEQRCRDVVPSLVRRMGTGPGGG